MSLKNGSEFINKEFNESYKPTEEIRIITSPVIAEKPFLLREAEYIKVVSKSEWSGISNGFIGAILVQILSIVVVFVKHGINSIEAIDIIILMASIFLLSISRCCDVYRNKEKREIVKQIKNHFARNRLHIDRQRETNGREN